MTSSDLTNKNYDIAIEMLKEHYGELDIKLYGHYSKFKNISLSNYKTRSLRVFWDETEKRIGALKSHRQDPNHWELLIMLKSKLPLSLLEKLEQQKDQDEVLTMTSFKKELDIYEKLSMCK